MGKIIIHVYTGDGKGKTTAAFGLALRAAGAGLKVHIVQFGKTVPSSEGIVGIRYKLFDVVAFWHHGFIKPDTDITPFREKTLQGIEYVDEILDKEHIDLLILDEIIVCLKLGVINRIELEGLIKRVPSDTELVLTGRGAPDWLIEKADLVTDMKKIKHYIDKEINARKGIEY